MSLYRSKPPALPAPGPSEFELLKGSHRFLREEDGDRDAQTWEEKLACKYYSSLYREFAVCDLKHYKSGNFSLRWRTESEVLSGAGESSCGNTRCRQHDPRGVTSALTTLELPFAYTERGEGKAALVKTVLCGRCLKKLMWKRRRDREGEGGGMREEEEKEKEEDDGHDREGEGEDKVKEEEEEGDLSLRVRPEEVDVERRGEPRSHRRDRDECTRRRSASPRRRR